MTTAELTTLLKNMTRSLDVHVDVSDDGQLVSMWGDALHTGEISGYLQDHGYEEVDAYDDEEPGSCIPFYVRELELA